MSSDANRLYLDHNATTPQSPAVTAAVIEAMEHNWGNPSSIHWSGQQAKRALDQARDAVAELIGSTPDEVIFTSGGSESVNGAIFSAVESSSDRRLVITSDVEHSAVRELMERLVSRGCEWIQIQSESSGRVSADALRGILNDRHEETALVSIMWANNETGVVQPIERLGEVCREYGVCFHTDGTQWVGKMPTSVADMPIDMLSAAGHKFHGPKGTGILWTRPGLQIAPTVVGGGQEMGRRGGTENLPAIVGLGVAAQEAALWLNSGGHESMLPLRDQFEEAVASRVAGICVNGSEAPRMWSTSSIGFPDVEAELLLLVLSEAGLDASAGSACGSGALKGSAVLEAMGTQPCHVPERQYGSVRFSWCRSMEWADLSRAVSIIGESVDSIGRIKPPVEPGVAEGNPANAS